MKRRGRALRRRYGQSKHARKQASIASGRHMIHNANPGDRDWSKANFIFWFGAHAPTYVRAWGSGIDSALDEAVDWLVDHKKFGLIADSEVEDEYKRLIAEGKSEEEAQTEAEVDTTTAGNNGHYLHSWEWGIVVENPTREQVLQIQGRAA